MRYQIIIKPAAEKCLDNYLDLFAPVLPMRLRDNPRRRGVVKLTGIEDLWRIRIGDYRVVYEIRDEVLVILVLRVAHRKDSYRP